MFTPFRSSRSASTVYARNLEHLLEGHALWFPEPQETGEVHLCDVGYINDGAFVRILNASPSADRPQVDFWGPNFKFDFKDSKPLAEDFIKLYQRKAPAPDVYKSHGLEETDGKLEISAAGPGAGAGLKIGYGCSAEQAALLKLKSWGNKKEIITTQHIIDYILENHGVWLEYAKSTLGLQLGLEDLSFVRGYAKTSPDWLVAAFSNSTMTVSAGMNGAAGAFASANVAFSKKQAQKSSPMARWGEAYDDNSPQSRNRPQSNDQVPAKQDQCIFIQRYIMKRRWPLGRLKMRAAAGPHELPDQQGEDAVMGVMAEDEDEDDSVDSVVGTVHTLLGYILEASDAAVEIAIACEEDVASLFLGKTWPSDLAEYLRTTNPQIEIVKGGTAGMLSLPEKIARQREHTIACGIDQSMENDHSSSGEVQAATLADGKLLLGSSSTRSGSLRWPHAVFKNKNEENGVVSSVVLSPDGSLLAVSWDDIPISIWSVKDGAHVQQLEENGHTDSVWTIAFSPDGQHLISGSSDTTVIVWEITTGEVLARFEGHRTDVTVVTYSPDGSLIATGSSDGCLKIWDTSSGILRYTLQDQDAEIRQLLFSSDGSRLVSCTVSGALLWDPTTGIRVGSLHAHNGAVWSVAFSPTGDRLVTGSEDHTARVWDANNGDELVTLQEHQNSVWAVSFSPDGQEVATASYDGTVVTCDSFSGERRHVFSSSQSLPIVEAVAYSKEHDFIASGSADGSVRVWNANSGVSIAEFQGHEEKVRGVMFTPDGWDLVSHAEDGTVRTWSVLDAIRL